jgi:hypothetical protein
MRSQADRDAELDALHARAAVLVAECEQLRPGPALTARLVAVRGLPTDYSTASRTAALWGKVTAWSEAQPMVAIAETTTAAEYLPAVDPADAMRLAAGELAVLTHVSSLTAMTSASQASSNGG